MLRIAPDQAVVLVGEPVAVPLADSADGVAQRRADRIDGVLGFGMPDDGFGIDPDRVDRADRLQVIAEPADGGGRTAGIEAVDELGDFFGTQGIGADGVALDRRPDVLQDAELGADGQVIARDARMIDRPDRNDGTARCSVARGISRSLISQQAEVVTHRPIPSPDVLRERPTLAPLKAAREGRRWLRLPMPRTRLVPESLAKNRVATHHRSRKG